MTYLALLQVLLFILLLVFRTHKNFMHFPIMSSNFTLLQIYIYLNHCCCIGLYVISIEGKNIWRNFKEQKNHKYFNGLSNSIVISMELVLACRTFMLSPFFSLQITNYQLQRMVRANNYCLYLQVDTLFSAHVVPKTTNLLLWLPLWWHHSLIVL